MSKKIIFNLDTEILSQLFQEDKKIILSENITGIINNIEKTQQDINNDLSKLDFVIVNPGDDNPPSNLKSTGIYFEVIEE